MKRKQRSGRKAGGDVLKAIDPAGSALANAIKLTYGDASNHSGSKMVRIWHSIERATQQLTPQPEGDRRKLDAWRNEEQRKFRNAATFALWGHDAGWFRRVADEIDAEYRDGQDKYPLHAAAMLYLGELQTSKIIGGLPQRDSKSPLSAIPRYTIREACDTLERAGYRPKSMEDWDWARTVRRACAEVGVKIHPRKPSTKPEKS